MTFRRSRGFVVVGNALAAGVFFLLVGVFGFNFFAEDQATTTVSIEPQSSTFKVGETILFDIFVATHSPFNALDTTLEFPVEFAEVADMTYEKSIIDVWVDEPTYSHSSGNITFTGGTARKGGAIGKHPIATVEIKLLKAGSMEINFSHSLALVHDSSLRDARNDTVDEDFVIEQLQDRDQTNVVHRTQSKTYFIKEAFTRTVDLNGDGKATSIDLSILLPTLSGAYEEASDFNGDGSVNLKDLSILMSEIIRK